MGRVEPAQGKRKKPVDEQAICLMAYKSVHELYSSKRNYCPFARRTKVTFVEADGGDLCEADDGKLATARSRTPQLPTRFNEASREAKTFFFLPASVLKAKRFQSSPGKLVVCPEAGGSDLSEADGGYLARAHSRTPQPVSTNAIGFTQL